MSTEDELQLCIQQISKLEATKNRLVGQLAGAEAQLGEVEDECRKRGLDPAKLAETCAQLEAAYIGKVAALSADIKTCAAQLARFQDGNGGI